MFDINCWSVKKRGEQATVKYNIRKCSVSMGSCGNDCSFVVQPLTRP